VVRIKGTRKSIAISVDCNSTYCYLDPYEGAKIAVAEAARNIACSGAKPLSVTNCLNFGNPMNPEIFWQLKKCVEGIRDACVAFETPVSGGNVSLYNQNPKGAIDPTPTIGMVGLIEGYDPVTSFFKEEGDIIVLLGESKEELGGSEYLKTIFNVKSGIVPRLDLQEARKLVDLLVALSKNGLLKSAHDCSEGGLAVALAESCVIEKGREIGAVIEDPSGSLSREAYLFGETQSRVVITVSPGNLKAVHEMIESYRVPHRKIGKVSGSSLKINSMIQAPLTVLSATWRNAIKRRMES
jgi:phosphoribosylformylglycinamidine (FGAM) synthase-like enzyme